VAIAALACDHQHSYSVVAALAQAGLHAAALLSAAMASTSPLLAGGLLVTAGVFQWTPLKRTCLAACRSPLSFFMTGWPISARADVWLRRAVRMAGEVTDRALRIPYVKGTVRLPAILFTVSAVPSGGKPPGTQRGGPAGVAGTDLPYHSAAGVTGNYSEDGDKDRARCRVRDAIRAGILIRPTRCDRGGRPEEQSPGSGRHPQGLAFAACRRVMADHF